MKKYTLFFIYVLLLFFFFSCLRNKQISTEEILDLQEIKERGELVVLTISGSTSYFTYRGEEIGYQYELSKKLAKDLGLKLKIKTVPDVKDLPDMLLKNEGDLIAFRLPITNELKQQLSYVDKTTITNQVLVQYKSDSMITNVVDLIGKEVYVKEKSKYQERLQNLNQEIGGGIVIKTVADSLNTEELIEMVSQQKIAYTVAENDLALLNQTYYQNIDSRLSISFSQRSAWAVRQTSPELLKAVNEWLDKAENKKFAKHLYQKYYRKSKYLSDKIIYIPSGKGISVYDDLFKKYAAKIDWDWRLLASLVYHESQLNPMATSWAGAAGLMQIMPATARKLGLDSMEVYHPELNLAAGVKYLKSLSRTFKRVEDPDERLKFVLAAYNVGIAHVLDARALAVKYGKNPNIWFDHVDVYIRLKSQPEYYNDPVCKAGYCRGEETHKYVRDVLSRYKRYMELNK